MLYQVTFALAIAMIAADSVPSYPKVSKGYGKGVAKGFGNKGFMKGYNGFNGGFNGFNGGFNGFNGGFNGFNGGFNGFNGGFNGFNGGYTNSYQNMGPAFGYNVFNRGFNGFNPGYVGFNGYNKFNKGYNSFSNGYYGMMNGGFNGGYGPMKNGFFMNRRVYPGYPRFGGNPYSTYSFNGYFGDDDDYKFGGFSHMPFRRGPFFQNGYSGGYNSGFRGGYMKSFGGPYQGMFRSSYPKFGYKSSISTKKGSY